MHAESAFGFGGTGPSTSPILPGQRHFLRLKDQDGQFSGESPRLIRCARCPACPEGSQPPARGERSEERRVGKEWRSRRAPEHDKKKERNAHGMRDDTGL